MKSAKFIKFTCFILLLLLYSRVANAQESIWFRAIIFNSDSKVLQNISNGEIGIIENTYLPIVEITKSHAIVYYINGTQKFELNTESVIVNKNNRNINTGDSPKKMIYGIDFKNTYGYNKDKCDTICHIQSPEINGFYCLSLICRLNPSEQQIDERLSVKVSRAEILKESLSVNSFKGIQNLIIVDGQKLYLGNDNIFTLKIIRGTIKSRHYIITNNGSEVIVNERFEKLTCLVSFPDGGIIRFYGKR
jgi:hypothetical protein